MEKQSKYITFILGAGASKPYDFPTGDELIKDIIDSAHSAFPHVAHRLNAFSPPSIDSFLKFYEEDDALVNDVKFLIANILLRKTLADRFQFEREGNWLRYLFWALFIYLEKRKYEVDDVPIRIVTFNYDLLVESYIQNVLDHAPFIPKDKQEKLKQILGKTIVHMYGQIGFFDWQYELYCKLYDPNKDNQRFAFQNKNCCVRHFGFDHHTQVFAAAGVSGSFIKLIGTRENDDARDLARQWLLNSAVIFICGYGFHPENNKLLFDASKSINSLENAQYVIATAKDCNDIVQDRIQKFLHHKVDTNQVRNQTHHVLYRRGVADKLYYLHNGDCASLFRDKVDLQDLFDRIYS